MFQIGGGCQGPAFKVMDVSSIQDGLITGMTDFPTWKYASPHNIVRVTPIQDSCNNCHAAGYADFWLTDVLADDEGWLPAAFTSDEAIVGSLVVVESAPSMAP